MEKVIAKGTEKEEKKRVTGNAPDSSFKFLYSNIVFILSLLAF